MKSKQTLFPHWLTTHIDLLKDQLSLPELQLAKQLASLPGNEKKKNEKTNKWCVTDNIIASEFYSGSPFSNLWSVQLTSCRKHGKLMVWPVNGMSAAVFPDSSLLNRFASATLHPRGNKSSKSAETGFLRFCLYGRKNDSKALRLSCHCMSAVRIWVCDCSKVKWNVCITSFV